MSQESITQTTAKKGFSLLDIEEFKKKGDIQSIKTGALTPPEEKTFARTLTATRGTIFGMGVGGRANEGLTESGFMGEFSDITPDQLDTLVNTFNNRRKLILDKKRAPGRSQLFMEGR